MSASRIDKTYLTEKALNSEEYKGFYITGDNEEYISDLNLINKQDGVNYKEVGFIHACTILFQDNGSANQGSMTFSNVVFDSNYDFNKIGLTYYDCDKLKEAGVLNFVDYKDCLGKSLIINNKNLNISKLVNKNSANSGDLTTYKKEFLYQNIYMSKKTSIMLFGNRENIIMPVNQSYTEILENESLTGNEISISKMAFKELFDSTDYSSLLGKEIELSFDLEERNFKNKFIIKEVSENIFNNISFSTEEFENIYYKENGFINESEFERTYYIDSWENNDLLKLALDNIYDNNLNVLFATSSELDSLYNEMHSLIILFKIISILIICLTLLFISYLVYNMYYINRAQFEALRLFGVSKLSLFIISLIDLLIPLVASIIIGTCLTFIASKKFVDLLVTNANVSFSFSVFDIRFIILSVLIICITIICASIIPFILKNKETSTYIRKN